MFKTICCLHLNAIREVLKTIEHNQTHHLPETLVVTTINVQPTRGFPIDISIILKPTYRKRQDQRRFHTTFQSYFGYESTSTGSKKRIYNNNKKNYNSKDRAKYQTKQNVIVPEG